LGNPDSSLVENFEEKDAGPLLHPLAGTPFTAALYLARGLSVCG